MQYEKQTNTFERYISLKVYKVENLKAWKLFTLIYIVDKSFGRCPEIQQEFHSDEETTFSMGVEMNSR